MRTALLVSALLGLAIAAPKPQSIDFDEVDSSPQPDSTGPDPAAVSEPVTYNNDAQAKEASEETQKDLADPTKHKSKRSAVVAPAPADPDACKPQPDGFGPKPTPDTVSAFLGYGPFAATATSAPTPNGYTRNFVNLQASSNAKTYLGLYTFASYDTQKCADKCNKIDVCTAFNIYFERDPTVKPADACPNPPSFTNIKCTLWGSALTAATALNKGQYRRDFQVVIAGSNGYSKPNPPNPYPGFNGPTFFGCAINAPDSYVGLKYFSGPYDAGQCVAACTTTTAYNKRHPRADGTYDACNFFNVYLLTKNGLPDGTACSLYTRPFDVSYATNCGQTRGNDVYTIDTSYGYSLNPQDSGHT